MAASNGLAYRPRIADAELHACLGAAGAVLFEALERLMVLENQSPPGGHTCVPRRPCARPPGAISATRLWRWRRWAASLIGS